MRASASSPGGCPPADVLTAFTAGDLVEHEIQTLQLHLGACSDCLTAVACLGQSAGGGEAGSTELAPGAAVGRYRILTRIGSGQFGVVYAAYDPDLDRKVALKMLRRRLPDDEDRFLREARAMARVSSPHVVAVHDVGRAEGGLFAAMEFVDGQTLGAWLASAPRSAREIVSAFVQAGRGLAAAHAEGIVHRDFKPDNVLVHKGGRVAVTDFGLAGGKVEATSGVARSELGSVGAVTIDGALVGTPLYMSPEGLRRQPVDARSDLFTFCVALYDALYAGHPFPANTVPELVRAIERGPTPPRDSRVPRHVRDAVLAGLRAEPASRPATMQALLRTLEHDPRRTRRRVTALAGGALAIAGGVVLRAPEASPPGSDCRARARTLALEVWRPEQRPALHASLDELDAPLARQASERVARVLDRYSNDWQIAWASMCESAAAGQQPAPLIAQRTACLEQRRARWASLVSTLEHPSEVAVINASSASYALPGVEPCADERWLAAFSSPTASASVASARLAIGRAQVHADLGDTEAGLAALRPVLELARVSGDRALEAEARLVEGDLRRAVDPRAAETPLHAAAIAASAVGRLDLEATAKVLLVQTLAHSQLRLAEAAREADYAGAAATRLGEPALIADYFYARALAEWSIGGAERSLPFELATLAMSLAVRGHEHPKVAEAQNSIAVSLVELDYVEASIELQRQALALRERLQGPDHPESLNARGNLAFALGELGHLDEAYALQQAVAAGRARVLGPDYFLLSETWIRLARLEQWELGRSEDAVRSARRARAIDVKELGEDASEGIASLTNLARILAARGEHAEAEHASARALAIAEASLPSTHLLVRIALATRGYVLEQAARCAEAIPILERLDTTARSLLSGRSELVFGLHALARCHLERDDVAEAEVILRRALALREQTRGSTSPMIADALLELAALERRRGRRAEAAAAAARAVAVRETTPGTVLARAYFELARSSWPADRRAALTAAERAARLLRTLEPCALTTDVERWLIDHRR